MSAKLIKLVLATVVLALLSGCFVHARHHGYRHHHANVQIHGHVHGRPSAVVGAVVAGAIIGGIINAAHQKNEEGKHKIIENAAPDGPHYYRTKDGRCFWVVPRQDGAETRELIEPNHCDDN